MRFTLQRKITILLISVACLGLTTAVLIKQLIVNDFKSFADGRLIDRVYQVQAVLERHYRNQGHWQPEQVRDDLTWVALSGFDAEVYGKDNQLIASTMQLTSNSLGGLQSLGNQAHLPRPATDAEWQDFPLFSAGEQIGRLALRFPSFPNELLFIHAANRFLVIAIIVVGGLTIVISLVAARKLTRPLSALTIAVDALADGRPAPLTIAKGHQDEIALLGRRFNEMAERILLQEELRKQVVSNAAHELRTPLMILRGELEGMLDGVLPTTPEALQSLHDETVRLARLLDGVDELTRAQQASQSLKRQPLALYQTIRQVIDRFERVLQEQHITVSLHGESGLILEADPDRLTQIMTNLISNAIKAMPHGGSLDIILSSTHNTCLIEVLDSGTGIPTEILPALFERFTKGFSGGLGLGLAITKELVQAHGGSITAGNRENGGSWFALTLPRHHVR